VAAYEWVDVGIGSGTNGSIRRPVQCCGVFGLRVSQGVFSHEGMFTVYKRFDVPGIFARDLGMLVDFAREWHAKSLEAPRTDKLPRKLVYLTDNMAIGDMPQKSCVIGVVRDMESFLGVEAIGVSVEVSGTPILQKMRMARRFTISQRRE
jgi:Asp-tRNA(Asn)/Glu-tRNA(Gln) amidotransferase A subunit family amidase